MQSHFSLIQQAEQALTYEEFDELVGVLKKMNIIALERPNLREPLLIIGQRLMQVIDMIEDKLSALEEVTFTAINVEKLSENSLVMEGKAIALWCNAFEILKISTWIEEAQCDLGEVIWAVSLRAFENEPRPLFLHHIRGCFLDYLSDKLDVTTFQTVDSMSDVALQEYLFQISIVFPKEEEDLGISQSEVWEEGYDLLSILRSRTKKFIDLYPGILEAQAPTDSDYLSGALYEAESDATIITTLRAQPESSDKQIEHFRDKFGRLAL